MERHSYKKNYCQTFIEPTTRAQSIPFLEYFFGYVLCRMSVRGLRPCYSLLPMPSRMVLPEMVANTKDVSEIKQSLFQAPLAFFSVPQDYPSPTNPLI